MDKATLEKACRMAGMAPARREETPQGIIYISDGFQANAEVFKRFGATNELFGFGVYCTMWWLAEGDRVLAGQPLLFDAFHDPEYDMDTKRRARVNTAWQEAEAFLKRREDYRAEETVH